VTPVVLEAVTPLGTVIALLYVFAISSILWRMLHVPKVGDVTQEVRRIHREEERFHRIVVPVQRDLLSSRLVALASQMARFRGAHMDLLYVVEVPLQFPIDAISEEERGVARQTFDKAGRIAARYDVKIHPHLEAARQAGPAIVRFANVTGADLIMMTDDPRRNRRATRTSRAVEYVLENAQSEVIIDRPALE
jgi:nucleotide-binding universal stress UspA family protein